MSKLNKDSIKERFNKTLAKTRAEAKDLAVTKQNGRRISVNDAVQQISTIIGDFQDLDHDVHLSVFDKVAPWKDDIVFRPQDSRTILAGTLKIGGGEYLFSLNLEGTRNISVLISKADITQIGTRGTKQSDDWEIKNRFSYETFHLGDFDGFEKFQNFITDKLAHQKWVAENDISNSLNNNRNLKKNAMFSNGFNKPGLKS